MLSTFRHWIFRAAVVAVFVVAPFGAYAQPIPMVVGAQQASAVFDWTQILQTVAYYVVVGVAGLATMLFNKTHADEKARQRFLGAAGNAAGFATNALDGYLKGHPIQSANVPPVLAKMLQYVQDTVPDAMKRLDITNEKAVKVLLAQLPGVQGTVDDATLHAIAAAASSKDAPHDVGSLAVAVAPEVEDLVSRLVEARFAAMTKPAAQPGQPQGSGTAG